MTLPVQLAALRNRGVTLVAPETLFAGPEVNAARIASGVTLHPGCRLHGAALAIGPGCVLGEEGPVTLRDCQLGARVRLRGGSFDGATLLDDVEAGSGAHVRPGTLLEEHVAFGHSVGLKQTVLLPHMTLGSLINFCDCLMGGGTGAENHSEVGSSYVHFNFTPHQEKATASLIGDVPRGVMLDQPPIFLGGQGGLVGPCRIAYGTVLAAGQICRQDILTPGRLVCAAAPAAIDRPYDPRVMGRVDRRVTNNLHYLGNLLALDAWWRAVRVRFAREEWQRHCHAGALLRLDEMLAERMRRMDPFAEKVALSLTVVADAPACASQRAFLAAWPAMRTKLHARISARTAAARPVDDLPEAEGRTSPRAAETDYLSWVRALTPAKKQRLTAWLQAVVNDCVAMGE
ncbi:MAG: UDP-N-acetylglucosamine pyrophosphorylase [bacterium]